MAVVDRAAAQAAAVVIRDETGTDLNTPLRVGTAMLNQADSVLYSGAAAALADRTLSRGAIAAGAILAGLVLANPDVATAGGAGDLTKHSPAWVQQSEVFSAGARSDVYVRAQSRPSTNPIVPTWVVSMGSALQGTTTADTASLTDALTLTPTSLNIGASAYLTTGFAALSGAGSYVAIGASPAASGALRVGLNHQVVGKNDVTVANMVMLAGYTGGHVQLGSSGAEGATLVSVDVRTGGQFDVYVGGTPQLVISATTIDAQNNNFVTTGTISAGVTPAGSGTFRGPNNGTLYFRNAANDADHLALQYTGANGLLIGDGLNLFNVFESGGDQVWNRAGVEQIRLALNVLNFHSNADTNFSIQGRGESMIGLNIAASGVRNLDLFGDGSGAMGGGDGIVMLRAAVVAPTGTSATAMAGRIWVDPSDGSLNFISAAGVPTMLAPG